MLQQQQLLLYQLGRFQHYPGSAYSMDQQQAHDSSPYTICSTILSMDCQPTMEQCVNAGRFHTSNNDKASTSCVSSSVKDDNENGADLEASNGTAAILQGTMLFDMLSAMQFASHPTADAIHDHDNQSIDASFAHIISATSSAKADHIGAPAPWHLNLHSRDLEAPHLPLKLTDNQPEPAHLVGFDPITSFLKLPVLADPTKLELTDHRLLSSYSSFVNSYKSEGHHATTTLDSNNHWFNSLQLETIGPQECSTVTVHGVEGEGHMVQFLDPDPNMNTGVPSLETEGLPDDSNEDSSMHDHEQRLFNERFNSNPLSMSDQDTYNNGQQFLYTLNQGDGRIQKGHQDDMFDSLQVMMLGYSEGAKVDREYAINKGTSDTRGANIVPTVQMKTGRRRGIRGTSKNSEEKENQRMTHIAVERNRRRQMNEHLRVLRALMPPSYIQRGDQASIIGGAIEFVRELEQLLQCLESQKRRRVMANPTQAPSPVQPLGYNFMSNNQVDPYENQHLQEDSLIHLEQAEAALRSASQVHEEVAQAKSIVADIEVKVVERSEALVKILSQRRPRQLLHTIVALQDHLHFSILHTNVTTIDNTVLYSFTIKMSIGNIYSANQIATSVHELFVEIVNNAPMKTL